MSDLGARALEARRFADEMWSGAADSAERTRAQLERHPELTAVAFGLAALLLVLIGLVAGAVRRSSRRHQAAHLRDDLVDAVRMGEIDPDDFRVFAMIDFCDRVARRGRRPHSGRHASSRPILDSALASSLISAVGPGSLLPPGGPFWPYATPEPGEVEVSDVWVRAVSFQRDLMGKRRSRTDAVEPVPTPGSGPARRRLISVPTPTTIDLRNTAPTDEESDFLLTLDDPSVALAESPDLDFLREAPASQSFSSDAAGLTSPDDVGTYVALSGDDAAEPSSISLEPDRPVGASAPGTDGVTHSAVVGTVLPALEHETLPSGPSKADYGTLAARSGSAAQGAAGSADVLAPTGPGSGNLGATPPGLAAERGTLPVGSGAADQVPAFPLRLVAKPSGGPGAGEGLLSAESVADPDPLIEEEVLRAEAEAVRLLEIVPDPGAPAASPVVSGVGGTEDAEKVGAEPVETWVTGEETAACVEETETDSEIESSAGDWFLEGQARPFDPLTDPLTAPSFLRGDEPSQELEPVFMAAAEAQRAAERTLREHREQQRILRERVARRWEAIEQVAQEARQRTARPIDQIDQIDLRSLEAPRQIDLTRVEREAPAETREPVPASGQRGIQSLQSLIQAPARTSEGARIPVRSGPAETDGVESGPVGRAGSGRTGALRGESGGGQWGRGESGRGESGSGEWGRGEWGRGESGRGESDGGEWGRRESGRGESDGDESGRGESGRSRAERAGADASESDLVRANRAEPSRSEAGRAGAGESASGRAEPADVGSANVGSAKVGSANVGTPKVESANAEPANAEPANAGSAHDEAAGPGSGGVGRSQAEVSPKAPARPGSSGAGSGRAEASRTGSGARPAGMAKHAISGPIDLPLALHRTRSVPPQKVRPQEQKEEAPPTNPIPRLDLPVANEVGEEEVWPGAKEASGSRPRWMTPGETPSGRTGQVGGVIEPAGIGAGDDPSGDRTPRNGFWGRRVHRRVRTTLTEVTGHGKPPGALMPFTGQIPVQIPVQGGAAAPEKRESEDEPARG